MTGTGPTEAYGDVKASALSTADVMVRGRALEGIGLALEGKGDLDGALKAFRELENTDTRGLKELGMYHQARILFAKGDTDKPRELLKGARERLKGTASPSNAGPLGESHPFQFLESQVDDLLRRIDPSAIPAPTAPAPGGGSGITPEQLQQLQEQLSKHKQGGSEAPPAPAGSPLRRALLGVVAAAFSGQHRVRVASVGGKSRAAAVGEPPERRLECHPASQAHGRGARFG